MYLLGDSVCAYVSTAKQCSRWGLIKNLCIFLGRLLIATCLMNRILLWLIPVILPLTTLAQNKGVVKGKVIDSLSNSPMEFATVAVLDMRDTASNLVAYTLTDKSGAFTVHNLPNGIPLKVYISFVAYQPYRKIIELNKPGALDIGTIRLNIKALNEVTITAERLPIVINKDTIEFNAEAFKVRPNAVVEDLLKKLPGMEVANDGSITVMGKSVEKVLVDGHEFFAADIRMATKNIDADMIDKVQVYDNRERDSNHRVSESQLKKIINLKFKKIYKKSIFGKGYSGFGKNDRYQAGGLVNSFRDTLQISILSSSNNLNSTGFDFNDLYTSGGLDRGGEALSRAGLAFGGGTGKHKTTTAGLNINTDYGKKLKINFAYIYKGDLSEMSSLSRQQQFLQDTTLFTNSSSESSYRNYNHLFSSTIVWKPNDKTELRYTPFVEISHSTSTGEIESNSYSNFVDPINNSAISNTASGNSLNVSHALSYNRQLNKSGASFGIEHSLSFNPGSHTNFDDTHLNSFVATFPSYTYMQRGDVRSSNTDVSLSASLNYPLSKNISADISTRGYYAHSQDRVSTYNYNPATGQYDSFLLEKSSNLNRDNWVQSINPGLSFDLPRDINVKIHFNTQFQQVNNAFGRNSADLAQHYTFFVPAISFERKGLSLNYSRDAILPNIGDLIPYTVVFSPSLSVTGNPDLKPTISDAYSINYSKYDFQSGVNYNLRASVSAYQNSVFRQRTLDAQLVETSTPINRDGRYNVSAGGYMSRQIKKEGDLHLSANLAIDLQKNHDFFVLNRMDGFQNSYRGSLVQGVSFNYKDKIQLEPQYMLTQVYTTYSGVDYASQKYITHALLTHFTFYLPWKTNVDGNYAYTYNPLVPAGFQRSSNLLTISMAHQFLRKDRGEIKFSCYDLLNQNINTFRSINQNSITDTQSQIIRRYFMVTLQFKFTKSMVKNTETETKSQPILIFPGGRM